jgi:hypothetical protein
MDLKNGKEARLYFKEKINDFMEEYERQKEQQHRQKQ